MDTSIIGASYRVSKEIWWTILTLLHWIGCVLYRVAFLDVRRHRWITSMGSLGQIYIGLRYLAHKGFFLRLLLGILYGITSIWERPQRIRVVKVSIEHILYRNDCTCLTFRSYILFIKGPIARTGLWGKSKRSIYSDLIIWISSNWWYRIMVAH